MSYTCTFYDYPLETLPIEQYLFTGKLSNMCHPSCTINKVRTNDYCTRRGVPRTMAYSHIKE